MKNIITIIFFFLFANLTFGQKQNTTGPDEEGRCYTECLILKENFEKTINIPVYIGDSEDEDIEIEAYYFYYNVVVEKLILIGGEEAYEDWKNPKNLSISFSLGKKSKEEEIEIIEYIILTDTTQTENYINETIEYLEYDIEQDQMEWVEVLCENRVKKYIVEIQKALKREGYWKWEINNSIPAGIENALKKYQQENNLPIGDFNLETLDELDVNY